MSGFLKEISSFHCDAALRANSNADPISAHLSLPLVSVIVINYNYGRFLKQAVESVFAQTYPNIECIIVDNASTDGSADVILGLSKSFPALAHVQRAENGGQSIATKEGFDASSGEYVVFLDADDFLLPSFVEIHIFVHLSLRIPVGLTSADMVQIVNSRVVLGTYASLSEYVRSGRGKMPGLFRRIDEHAPEVWPLPSPDAALENQVYFVAPCDLGNWVWAPTSGNCFRRDALQLFLNNEGLAELRGCTDAYLLRGISVLMGSVLIDRSLAVYRMHGMNVFSKHPPLYCMMNFDRGGPADLNDNSRKILIDHMIATAKILLHKCHSPHHFIRALEALNEAWPPLPSPIAGCPSYLAGKLVSESAALAPELGRPEFFRWLKRLKVKWGVILLTSLRLKTAKPT